MSSLQGVPVKYFTTVQNRFYNRSRQLNIDGRLLVYRLKWIVFNKTAVKLIKTTVRQLVNDGSGDYSFRFT